jgi:imidazolonepropionase-like amidohydrolase
MNDQAQTIAFQHVRIFDGTKILSHDTLVMQNGAITAIGDETITPPDAEIIDGTGQTLLPGLIDAHTHIRFVLVIG